MQHGIFFLDATVNMAGHHSTMPIGGRCTRASTVSVVLNWEFGSSSSLEEPWMGRVGYALVSLYLWVLVCINLQYVVEAVC